MVDNSGSSKAQMPSLSQEGGLGGVSAGVKLEAVMEQLQRQQQARLEMERKERHLREAHIMYAQQVAAQQAILAAARASGTPVGAASMFLGAKGLGLAHGGGGGGVGGPMARMSNQSSVDSERDDEEDRGRDSEEEEDEEEEEMMMDGDGGSEEDEEEGGGGGGGLEYLRKQTLALQQGGVHLPASRPSFPSFSASSLAPGPRRALSPPVRVKQEPEEENRSPTGPPSSSPPNGQADWGYDEPYKQDWQVLWEFNCRNRGLGLRAAAGFWRWSKRGEPGSLQAVREALLLAAGPEGGAAGVPRARRMVPPPHPSHTDPHPPRPQPANPSVINVVLIARGVA
ncbi:hypothetical protein JZ751_020456, partial [Albula glossodonta]